MEELPTVSPVNSVSPIIWPELQAFIESEKGKNVGDVDNVLWIREDVVKYDKLYGLRHGISIVGFACLQNQGYLSFLYVTPEHRRSGLASQFLEQYPIKTLLVRPDNFSAQRLYLRHGFQVTATLPHMNRLRMERK